MGAPSVGSPVHYVARGSADGRFPPVCRAAVVTTVLMNTTTDDGGDGRELNVGLAVLNPSGLFFDVGIEHHGGDDGALDSSMCTSALHRPGTWHWPAPRLTAHQ